MDSSLWRFVMLNKDYRWDIDLSVGEWGENLLVDILKQSGNYIEVKTDLKWQDTGNIFVETECFYINENKVKPSALNTSEAQWYAFVLPWGSGINPPIIKIIPTKLLKKVVKARGRLVPANQDGPNPTEGYLITLDDIEYYLRELNYKKGNAIVADNIEEFMEKAEGWQ